MAQQARTLIIQDLLEALRRVDILALPTVAIPAPRIGQQSVTLGDKTVNVTAALARFTLPFNLAGLPAITVPCGFTSNGLPIGLQIAGRAFAEPTILASLMRMRHRPPGIDGTRRSDRVDGGRRAYRYLLRSSGSEEKAL